MPEGQGQTPSAESELRRLCSALHLDAPIVRRFIGDYLRLLEFRLDRIDRDLGTGDIPAAVVGLLSLSASSSMLGATGVAEAAHRLRLDAAAGDRAAITEGRNRLVAQARRTQLQLARIENSQAGAGVRP